MDLKAKLEAKAAAGCSHLPYDRLKGLLREKHISYERAAELLGISPSSVCNKINGKTDFTMQEALLLGLYLQVTVDNIFPETALFLPEGFENDNF